MNDRYDGPEVGSQNVFYKKRLADLTDRTTPATVPGG
jgi:hypothetical protein